MINSVKEITQLARQGNIEAKCKLIELNADTIIKKAHIAYHFLCKLLKDYYNIESNNYVLPNNIIEESDFIQDFYIKAMRVLDLYLNRNFDFYFSTYLDIFLDKYVITYSKKVASSIIMKNKYEYLDTIDLSDFRLSLKLKRMEDIDEIKNKVKKDIVLNKHTEFVDDIFNGYTCDNLSLKYNLNKKRLSMKINKIGEIYNNRIKYNNNVDINNNDNYKCKSLLIKYMPDIDKITIDIYKLICKYFDYSYEKINYEFINLIDNAIFKYIENNKYDSQKINKYIKEILPKYKIYYLKYKILNNTCNNNCLSISNQALLNYSFYNDMLETIKNGHIFNIHLYRHYILNCINETYKYMNKENNINYRIIYDDYIIAIKQFIEEYFKQEKIDIELFNDNLFSILSKFSEEYKNKKVIK